MRRLLLIISLTTMWSMSRAAHIAGNVTDTNGTAMPFVTISLLDADSSLVSGTITDDHGWFEMSLSPNPTLKGREYIVKASYIGYETQCLNPGSDADTLYIRMREESRELSEVTVLQKAPLVERRMDKIVMNVASSPFAVGNNGKDILKKAPGVHIDRKGKITVTAKR